MFWPSLGCFLNSPSVCLLGGISFWGGAGALWGFRLLVTSFHSPSGFGVSFSGVLVFAAGAGGGGAGVFSFLGHAFAMCPASPHDQQNGFLPSTTTNILLLRQINTFGMFWNPSLSNVMWISKSPVSIPALLLMAFTSLTSPNSAKKAPSLSPEMSMGTP